MKRAFLLLVVPALLAALGFAQTPAASSNSGNTDQVNVKGCLGGSDGNYTVAEDNTGKIFKITTSSADLKAYVGQDVNVTGNKAGAGENSVAVTGLNMISEHCTPAAAAPAAIVSAPAETVSTPPAAAQPAAEPASIVATPSVAAAPADDAPASAAPAAIINTPSETASAPAAAVHRRRSSAPSRKQSESTAASAPAEPVSTPVADAAAIAPAGPPSATANAPAAPAAPATKASTSGTAAMFVSIIVVVVLIGGGVPLYNRWRKRKLLEQTRGQNLSFTKEAKSDPGKSDTTGGRKAA